MSGSGYVAQDAWFRMRGSVCHLSCLQNFNTPPSEPLENDSGLVKGVVLGLEGICLVIFTPRAVLCEISTATRFEQPIRVQALATPHVNIAPHSRVEKAPPASKFFVNSRTALSVQLSPHTARPTFRLVWVVKKAERAQRRDCMGIQYISSFCFGGGERSEACVAESGGVVGVLRC